MSNGQTLRILACQIHVGPTRDVDSRNANLDSVAARVSSSASKGQIDLIVLPELCSIEYSRQAFENLDSLSETLEGPSFVKWRSVAREFGTYVAYGFPRRAKNGYLITTAIVDRNGDLVGHYDKIHLAQYGASMEKEYFVRGGNLFIFEIDGFRIAPIICYDIRIPELSRTLATDHHVDLILHPGAYSRDPSFYSWHHFVVTRAIENQVFFLSVNRAGAEYGNSIFCPPWVDERRPPVVLHDQDEQITEVLVERSEIDLARKRYSFLKDRLLEYNLPYSYSTEPDTDLD